MTTYQHLIQDTDTFVCFLDQVLTNSYKKILVQIHTAESNGTLKSLSELIHSYIGDAIIIGSVNTSIIYNGQILSDKTMIAVTLFTDIHFDVLFQNHSDFSDFDLPKELYHQSSLPSHFQLLSTMTVPQNQLLMDTIKNLLPSTIISGGILNPQASVLFYDGAFFNFGYIGLVFYGETLEINHFSTSSIISIGREHEITKSNDHIIHAIDQIPARQFYESYIGTNVSEHTALGFKFPFVIHKDEVTLPTSIKLCEDKNALYSSLPTHKGDKVTLGYGDVNYLIKELHLIRHFMATIPCDYLISFASEKRTKEIISHIDDFYLNLPSFGLMTSYEFIQKNGTCYITSDSITMTTIAGHEDQHLDAMDDERWIDNDAINVEHSVLLKLVENTSKELNTLNRSLENMVVQKTNELLEHYYTDQLTRLPNLNRLSEDLAEQNPSCLCLIDISAFININNFYGATIGNKVLTELANLIIKYNELNHFKTYRIHSDIFAVLTNDTSYRLFCNRMKLLQTKIHKHCFVSNHQKIYINTTFALSNMGLALYENASMTLEHAKAEKISYLIYNERLKIEDSIISNLTWTNKIRNAIVEDRIVPFYQPIYNNSTDNIDRFEVLMRLIDEEGMVISPFQFLPIAKKAGLYEKLTKIIIKKAFDYFADKDYKFSINLSADDILNDKTRHYIYNRLVSFNKPENVIFEIVESESIENYDLMITFINEIKRYGSEIAIDDFGTGFSNFHYLFKLNVDCIKIDGSIIQQMQVDPQAEIVAETIVQFAQKMGISTVAEYVSDEKIFQKTREMGIGYSQGFFVARPAADIVM